ncbi:MAG: divalent-cation tolerance protein CutA [Acidobacteria bacterium]|nr:divalent-cation tolerance protein CutA [Acidobacteriota bacterium]
MQDALVVLCTAKDPVEAHRIARALVENRFAACVSILPAVESIYRWQGVNEQATESLLVIKTTRSGYPALETAIAGLHSYEAPEILALEVADGSSRYLGWIGETVLAPSKSDT